MLLRTTLQVCCLPKENANNRDHNIMHDLGKSPRFKILYNLNLKNSVTYLKNNSSPIFSIPENDGLQSTDLAHYNPPQGRKSYHLTTVKVIHKILRSFKFSSFVKKDFFKVTSTVNLQDIEETNDDGYYCIPIPFLTLSI